MKWGYTIYCEAKWHILVVDEGHLSICLLLLSCAESKEFSGFHRDLMASKTETFRIGSGLAPGILTIYLKQDWESGIDRCSCHFLWRTKHVVSISLVTYEKVMTLKYALGSSLRSCLFQRAILHRTCLQYSRVEEACVLFHPLCLSCHGHWFQLGGLGWLGTHGSWWLYPGS